jgi:hypothetical protein
VPTTKPSRRSRQVRAARLGVAAVATATALVGGLQVVDQRPAEARCFGLYDYFYGSDCNADPDGGGGGSYPYYDPCDPFSGYYDPYACFGDPFGTPPFNDPNNPRPPEPAPPPPPPTPSPTPGPFVSLPLPASTIGRPLTNHHDHPSVDIPVPEGTPVSAIEGGTVAIFNEARCGLGVQVTTSTGNQWKYCHLSRRDVTSGRIAAGTQIGASGNTGNPSTGAHLHVQVKVGNVLRCPQPLIGAVLDRQAVPPVESLPSTGCVGAGPYEPPLVNIGDPIDTFDVTDPGAQRPTLPRRPGYQEP